MPGSLEDFCGENVCPALADARDSLRRDYQFPGSANYILQRPCTAADGSPRVSVSADYWSFSRTYIYDAETEQLVGIEFTDDLGIRCDSTGAPTDTSGYYGEVSPSCGFNGSHSLPAACDSLDAGVSDAGPLDAGADAGPPVCVLSL